jgi:hypothetical protein
VHTPATLSGVFSFMAHRLDAVQVRRLIARTLRVALDGGPAASQLTERWAAAEASEDSWLAAITWDGVGAALGWALASLDLRHVAPPSLDVHTADAHEEAKMQAAQLTGDLERIGAEFHALGVSAIALKGSALLAAPYAPDLGIRWMNDVDLLVTEVQVEQAAWILESLDYMRGYEPSHDEGPQRPFHETFTSPEGRLVELHWRLGPARWGRATSATEWFARAEPAALQGLKVPAAADLFWHFLLHDARNHAWSTGSLRAALDLALVARAPGFDVGEVLRHLQDDPRPEPLVEAIADAAHLSGSLASSVEPAPQPRFLRLAGWRDFWGRRRWPTDRIAETIAFGASLDRARRYGGWKATIEFVLRGGPESATESVGVSAWRSIQALRHAAFLGALAAGHFIAIPERSEGMKRLPRRNR